MNSLKLESIIPDFFDEREKKLTAFAHQQHGEQKRKYTGDYYVVHLIKVASTVKEYSEDPVLPATALCHDLFEDTDCPEDLLRNKLIAIGYDQESVDRIIRYTWELTDRYTKDVHAHLTRRQRKQLEAQRLVHIKSCSATVKCADVLDNAPSIAEHDPSFAKVYVSEVMDFLPAMEKGNGQLFAKAIGTCKNILDSLPRVTSQERKKISKTLSLVLRHRPELFQLEPDVNGWVKVEAVLLGFAKANRTTVTPSILQEVVESCDKQRFAFSKDGQFIRANQGHSITIDLAYEAIVPPAHLFHGTAERFLGSILREGLKKRKRHHVHLATDIETAHKVGSRHGKPVILNIDAATMQANGFLFYKSENGVWLVDHVPVEYIRKEK